MTGEQKTSIRGDEWIEEQGLILFRGKVYVPRDKNSERKLHAYIIVLPYQDILDAGRRLSS